MRRLFETFRRLMIPLTIMAIVYWIQRSRATHRPTANSPRDVNLRSFTSYTTAHDSYRMWPDYLFEFSGLPVVVTLSAIVISVFLVGLVIAWPFGFVADYVSTPADYLGLAGVALVIVAIHWGSCRVHRDFEQLRPVFTVTDAEYLKKLDKWLATFVARKRPVFARWCSSA
jgi:hypothetical protein